MRFWKGFLVGIFFGLTLLFNAHALAQLPSVANSKLAVDCVRTKAATFYGIVIQRSPIEVQLVTERQWLKDTYPQQFLDFRKQEDQRLQLILGKYEKRIDAWISERSDKEDLVQALNEQKKQIMEANQPAEVDKKKFIVLSFNPKDIKSVIQQPIERQQIAAFAWQDQLNDVTITSAKQLKQQLQDRKGTLDEARLAIAQQLPASDLTDTQWENRKAMFEYVALRQMEYQGHGDLLLDVNDATSTLDVGQLLNSVLSGENGNLPGNDLVEIGRELGLPEFQNLTQTTKDWRAKITAKADRNGFRSILIKRSLPSATPDLAEVEVIFLAKSGDQWQTLKTVRGSAKVSDQTEDHIARIAADPQVEAVTTIMQGLGLAADNGLLQQAITQGAAVEQASREANQQMGIFLQLNTLRLDMPYASN